MKKTYEEIFSEMERIAEVVKNYPESLQEKAFDVLIASLTGRTVIKAESDIVSIDETENVDNPVEEETAKQAPVKNGKTANNGKAKPSKSTRGTKVNYNFDKSLNLLGSNNFKSLKDYYNSYKIKTNQEAIAVFVYYLKTYKDIEEVSIDQIYTCYKEVGRKLPADLNQACRLTSSAECAYINFKNNICTLHIKGENLVEHELEKKE